MRNSKHNFTEAMDAAKVRAVVRSSRGLGSGKAAKGWVRNRHHHTPAKGSWDRLLADTRARWHHAAGDAIGGYQWACNPSRADVESFFDQGGSLI